MQTGRDMRIEKPQVGPAEAAEAMELLARYRAGKARLEGRIVENERWWRLRHWETLRSPGMEGEPEPASAWLQNCIAAKHADAMDHFPEPAVLAREEGSKEAAQSLSLLLPAVLEENGYEQVYSDMWWYKLKNGTGVTGVFWNPDKAEGKGDVDLRHVDLLNLFWEPGVRDIQDSPHLFCVELWDRDYLRGRFPAFEEAQGEGAAAAAAGSARCLYDESVDISGKTLVVDWYYKKRGPEGRTLLHYAKIAQGAVLYASENIPAMRERGFYDHGLYPFVFDALFPEEGSPTGYGYVDICKSPQTQIDLLNQAIVKNAMMAARPRFFIRGDGSLNEEEYADWSRDFIHYHGSGNPRENIEQLEVKTLPDIYVAILNNKIEELKETSGNRDFNQGGAAKGVTAAAAIAALQEAGSKLSRDMIKSAYRAYAQVCRMLIALIRQFYEGGRRFRIERPGAEAQYASYAGMDAAGTAVFDVKVKPTRANAYSRISQNELAMSLFKSGFFEPGREEQALQAMELMDFEGREAVMAGLRERQAGRAAAQPPISGLKQGGAEAQRALAGGEDRRMRAARQAAGTGL